VIFFLLPSLLSRDRLFLTGEAPAVPTSGAAAIEWWCDGGCMDRRRRNPSSFPLFQFRLVSISFFAFVVWLWLFGFWFDDCCVVKKKIVLCVC
jgi:hypothetical protein